MSGTGIGTPASGGDAAYFTINELRAAHPDLHSATRYPDAKLEADRAFAEQWFEAAVHAAYVPRETTVTLTGNGRRTLFLPHWIEVGPVTAGKVDGVALTDVEIAALVTRKHGAVANVATWTKDAEIELTYTHGYATPVELARQAVMMLTAEKALPSTIPSRATSLSTDIGNYRISQADKTGKTGIPDVDAIIGLLGEDKPATG